MQISSKDGKLEHDPVEYYTRAVQKYPLLSKEQEYRLACAIKEGDAPSERLFIQSNLRLVLKVATHYRRRGLAFSDLIEEGNIGLMHAVKRFDPDRGFRFATYAVWWIRQAIERALMMQTRTIRLPVHVVKEISRVSRQKESQEQHIRDNPEASLESEESDLVHFRNMMMHRQNTLSLEQSLHRDSESGLMDSLAGSDDPERNVSGLDLQRTLGEALACIPAKEAKVVAAYFGLHEGIEVSMSKIAEQMKISRDQARRFLQQGLKNVKKVMQERNIKLR